VRAGPSSTSDLPRGHPGRTQEYANSAPRVVPLSTQATAVLARLEAISFAREGAPLAIVASRILSHSISRDSFSAVDAQPLTVQASGSGRGSTKAGSPGGDQAG